MAPRLTRALQWLWSSVFGQACSAITDFCEWWTREMNTTFPLNCWQTNCKHCYVHTPNLDYLGSNMKICIAKKNSFWLPFVNVCFKLWHKSMTAICFWLLMSPHLTIRFLSEKYTAHMLWNVLFLIYTLIIPCWIFDEDSSKSGPVKHLLIRNSYRNSYFIALLNSNTRKRFSLNFKIH